jgi:CubicO group peptidase (beta-lactamase class C family)
VSLESIRERLQALVERTVEREKKVHNVVLGAARGDGSFHWSGAAGMAEPGTGRAMEPQTPFLIASVTKMYTAAATMIMAERGELALDDSITKYLAPELVAGIHHYKGQDYSSALTIRHLLGQTTGLPDYFMEKPEQGKSVFERIMEEGDRGWELEDVVQLTREQFPARFAPQALHEEAGGRTKAHYSDTNYKLLGAILEAVTAQPLQAIFRDLFFEPLQLADTYLYGHPRGEELSEPAQVFYNQRPLVLDKLMASHGPEGGVVSTVDDSLRFGKAFMNGELFASEETLPAMQQWNKIFFPLQYGYGLMRFKLPWILSPFGYSPELVGHSGSSGSFLYYDRKLDLYMAGTINQIALRNTPFQLMIKAAQTVKKEMG